MIEGPGPGPVLWAWRLPSPERPLQLKPLPESNLGFREADTYLIARPSGAGFSLHIDDEPLELVPDHGAAWVWEPRYFAGEVTAELRFEEERRGLYLLDVSPDPAKSGRATFDEMVGEIWAEDPGLVGGTEPPTLRVGELGTDQDPLLELARLRRHAPAFIRALDAVIAHPRRTLVARRESVPMHRVCRVDRQTAVSAVRNPDVAAYLLGSFPGLGFHSEPQLDVPTVHSSLDSAANRCLLSLVQAMQRRAQVLHLRLRELIEAERESQTRTPLATRWPARRSFLIELGRRMAALIRRQPFSEVQRAEITAAGLNAVSADPAYARAWSRGWRAIRPGISGPLASDRLWISPTWEIYERWCFVRLAALLRGEFPGLAWKRDAEHPTVPRSAWLGEGEDLKIELLLQPQLRGRRRGVRNDLWSISLRRVPDLVLIVEDRRGRRALVLDAKYRCARSAVLDAMTSAHIYQDSLRIGEQRLSATLLLIPAGGGASWLEDPRFHREHRVGVHVFSAAEGTALPDIVGEVLAA